MIKHNYYYSEENIKSILFNHLQFLSIYAQLHDHQIHYQKTKMIQIQIHHFIPINLISIHSLVIIIVHLIYYPTPPIRSPIHSPTHLVSHHSVNQMNQNYNRPRRFVDWIPNAPAI